MNALEKIIRDIIAGQGAISMAAYMELVLQHKDYGYYRVHEPIGRDGDFITAPEVSQMFGEMLGVWCAETWRLMGKPEAFALVELGPGRGTMMQDILRATAHVGGFHAAKQLFLIDSDRALRYQQHDKLSGSTPRYISALGQLPPMPLIILANEFFDALPVRQFEKGFRGWCERMVTVVDDALVVTLRPLDPGEESLIPTAAQNAVPGNVIELSPKTQNIMRECAGRIAVQKGAMLVIDYGYIAASGAATVQAVSRHSFADIFARPGEIDLTAHVDFTALGQAAREAGGKFPT
jgi:NADH dehydrogenase [ubiquinone] 1 alpha subcomplex assembly factor 7